LAARNPGNTATVNLLLNASNLRQGGGKTVALQLMNGLAPLRPHDKLYVLAPDTPEYAALAIHPNISLLPVPAGFHQHWLEKLRQMHFSFPRWCRRLRIDKVVSLGNAAFPAKGLPQLVYIQLAQLVNHDSPAWKQMDTASFLRNSLMDQFVAFHLRYATAFAVQTPVMRRRFAQRFHVPEQDICIVPNAPFENGDTHPMPLPLPASPMRLLFLSRYYAHKNFECLPALAELLQQHGVPVQITLTLNRAEASGAARILDALAPFPFIQNVGPIALPDIGAALDAHHGVFLPSLLESHSGVYAEALLHRRHIFTSHYDFARDMLGEAAFYFDPLSPAHIARVLEEAALHPRLMSQKLRNLEMLAQQIPRIGDICRDFSKIIDSF
jgi:glycosyltransferase involved in cell wall biosynthesis